MEHGYGCLSFTCLEKPERSNGLELNSYCWLSTESGQLGLQLFSINLVVIQVVDMPDAKQRQTAVTAAWKVTSYRCL